MKALIDQTDGLTDWELLVVDNDDPPGQSALIAELAKTFPVPCRYVNAPMRGACHARNAGIRAAAGNVLAFIDDDVVPQPGWLSRLVGPVLDGRYDGAAGEVRLDWRTKRPSWLAPNLDSFLAEYRPYDAFSELQPGDHLL